MNPFELDIWGTPTTVRTVVEGNTTFALDLYCELRTAEGNLFFSPYSISTALAMTYAGARRRTADQIARALHLTLGRRRLDRAFASLEARLGGIGREGHVQLCVANALWPHVGYPFTDAFLARMRRYGAQLSAVDYTHPETARRTINAWVADRTEHKVRDVIPRGILDDLTRLVLVNAIYFKGDWASQFDASLTRAEPFWIAPDRRVEVPVMRQSHRFEYGERDGLQVLALPYAGEELDMVVLLPRELDGLAALEARLTVDNLEKWTEGLREVEVDVLLPKFEVTCPFRLDATLQSMGVIDAFDMDLADFSGMDGTRLLYLVAVLHKAFVAVDEAGTEAAAATAAVVALRGGAAPAPVFRADHPFVYLIRERGTGSILFLGRIVNPAQV